MAEEIYDKCTFFVTGNALTHQGIFRCITCSENSEENTCCCAGCSKHCHQDQGHEVEYLANGLAYCDCGSRDCGLLKSTYALDGKLLQPGEKFLCHPCTVEHDQRLPFGRHDIVGTNPAMGNIEAFLQLVADECVEIVSQNKETFWVGSDWQYMSSADSKATTACSCILEELALSIFDYHVKHPSGALSEYRDMAFDPRSSGAEWWIQVKDLEMDQKASGEKEEGEDESPPSTAAAIDLHYDKDEDIAEKYGVGVFPVVSTVTYITTSPGTVSTAPAQPTIILPITINDPVGLPIFDYILSYPRVGKHINFDGRLLHGAPSVPLFSPPPGQTHPSATDGSRQFNKRITFLVNVWLNHHPAGVQRLPADIATNLKGMDGRLGVGSLQGSIGVQKCDDASGAVLEVNCDLVSGEGIEQKVSSDALDMSDIDVALSGVDQDAGDGIPIVVSCRVGGSSAGAGHDCVVSSGDMEAYRLPFVTADSTWGGYAGGGGDLEEEAEAVAAGQEVNKEEEEEEEEEESGLIVRLVVPPESCIAAHQCRNVTSSYDCIRITMAQLDILASGVEYEE
jgi:hypothetical protein